MHSKPVRETSSPHVFKAALSKVAAASRRLRRSGRAPGIVYGGSDAPTPIELDHNALFHALRNEAFHASILTMKLDGSSAKVLLRDVQMHPFKNEILHVDFQRVDENKKIHMKVPLHFANGDASPAVKVSGAVVSHVANHIARRVSSSHVKRGWSRPCSRSPPTGTR